MFRQTVDIYDAVYRAINKDYVAEAAAFGAMITEHKRSPGRRLLDVACGTAAHLEQWQHEFQCQGLDVDPGMVEFARGRVPEVPIHVADMAEFELPDRFDAVVTDQVMPGITGTELAQSVASVRPNLPVILCSGCVSVYQRKAIDDARGASAAMRLRLAVARLFGRRGAPPRKHDPNLIHSAQGGNSSSDHSFM